MSTRSIRKRIEDMVSQGQFSTSAELMLANLYLEATEDSEDKLPEPGEVMFISSDMKKEVKVAHKIAEKYLPRIVQSVISQYKGKRNE